MAGPSLVEALLQGERVEAGDVYGRSLAGDPPESFELRPTKRVTISIAMTSQVLRPANVVALIEGSDPVLRDEYVTLQAHLDGTVDRFAGTDAGGNAADDNASGVVGLLGIAEAFAAAPRPRRSIVLLWDSAEERGLLGTQHFLSRGAVPPERIVTHFNLDMIGRSREAGDTATSTADLTGPNEVHVIGPRSMSSRLDALVQDVNRDYLRLAYNRRYDTWESEWLFPRADHIPFLQRGVPIVFFFTGMHGQYHFSTDNPELIDVSKVQRIAQTAFVTAWMVANSAERPTVDKPLPEALRRR